MDHVHGASKTAKVDTAADLNARLARMKVFFENLSPASLDQIGDVYAHEACFKDPFQAVHGLDAIRGVFKHMFTMQPTSRFTVLGITHNSPETLANAQCCLRWSYSLELAGKAACIEGCSWIRLDPRGYIIDHRDYWDAAEELYEKLPVLSWLMRWLRRKIAPG